MYQIRDLVFSDRAVTMADGFIVHFSNATALVPDQYIDYFRRISDFVEQTHTVDQPTELAIEQEAQADTVVATTPVVVDEPAIDEATAEIDEVDTAADDVVVDETVSEPEKTPAANGNPRDWPSANQGYAGPSGDGTAEEKTADDNTTVTFKKII